MMNLLSTDMLTDMDDSGDEEDDEHERLLSHRPPPHSDPSSILDRPMLRALHSRLLPELLREDYGWKLVYSLINDGASLHTLMRKAMALEPASTKVLVIEDSYSQVFGALICGPLDERRKGYYGTGETCLFSFHNQPPEDITVYHWTQANELFVLSDGEQLAFGGGGGFGIHLDNALDNGVSSPCATFGNDRPIASTEFFKTLNVELFSLKLSRSSSASDNLPDSRFGVGDSEATLEFDV